jgi:hypothetical protein
VRVRRDGGARSGDLVGPASAMTRNEDAIWNRACAPPPPELDRPGDRALQAILFVHGQIMNGGLTSALEYRSPDEVETAAAGFAYFGRDDIATVLRDALTTAFPAGLLRDAEEREEHMFDLPDETIERLEAVENAYDRLVPGDEVPDQIFQEHFRSHPHDFAPVE